RVSSHASTPRISPNRMNHGRTESGWPEPGTSRSEGTLKEGRTPKKDRPMKVAVTEDSATPSRLIAVVTGSISSTANTMPPIGVLKSRGDAAAGPRRDQDGALPDRHGDQL